MRRAALWSWFLRVSLGSGFLLAGCEKKAPPPPPPEVQVVTVSQTNLPVFEEWIGTLEGYVNAQIHAQVTGYLLSLNYTEGSQVSKGDLLFQIDPRPFKLALEQVEAKLAQDEAQLGKARLDVKRYTPLAKDEAISQEELDNAVQASLAAEAQVKSDQALVDNAKVNLEFTRITSPIDGLAGIALAQTGDLVGPSSSVLTTVSTVNPIKVYFQANEQSYLTFWRHRIADTNGSAGLPLELILSDGSVYPEPGRFLLADRQVNPTAGTLQIAGVFSNATAILRPGQYGRVRAQTRMLTNAVVVRQRTITELQGTYQVTVIDEQNKAHVRPVKVGQQSGGDWVVTDGLKPGERIVMEGIQKAKEGVVVNPQPFRPATNATPAK